MDELSAFLASPAGLALKGALVAAFIDFATGSFAAVKDGTFAFDVVAAFLRKHLLGRVAPLAALLAAGYFADDGMLLGLGIAGLTAYAAETTASVKGNLLPPKESLVVERAQAKDTPSTPPLNPVPTE